MRFEVIANNRAKGYCWLNAIASFLPIYPKLNSLTTL